ncbi:MAG: zinc ribbon domain-containing protein [Armatimonadetes bacterium]|nr:zinc ribbon domain-containing protein [Armatimonadota bacterium]
MICLKCGHKNPDHLKHCEKCNAVLLKMTHGEPQAAPSMIDVEDGQSYIQPERMYPTELIFSLIEAGYHYFAEQGTREDFLTAVEETDSRLASFEKEKLPRMMATYQEWKEEEFTSEYGRQMIYLVTKGFRLFREGLDTLQHFLSEDGDDRNRMVEGLIKVQEGNDNIALALELVETHIDIVGEEMKRRQMEAQARAFKEGKEKKEETYASSEAKPGEGEEGK